LSTPFCLLLPRRLYDEMIAQARAELPNECCGLLGGRIIEAAQPGAAPRGVVERRYALVNDAASPTEYMSEPYSMFAAEKDRRKDGVEFLAVYHSHPTSDPIPSRTDRERSYSPEVMNLIISLKSAEAVVRAWWLTSESYREAEWLATEETP
jgi:proteasome lid subunit RPN8/RPN11